MQFTPEEQAARRAEAEAAHAAEQRMLDLGISKVAARYYQLEGAAAATNASGLPAGGPDPLELATEQLLAEERAATEREQQPQHATGDDEQALDGPGEESEAVPAETDVPSAARDAEVEEDAEVPVSQVLDAEEAAEESKSQHPASADEDSAAADAARILGMSEAEMQRIRDERVAESFHIYKKQLEARKKGSSVPPPSRPSTWDTPAPTIPEEERPLYWSEAMDIQLAKLVKTCVFDFEAICQTMQQLASKNALANPAVFKKPSLLTNEACRLRWAQLDAQQWSTVAPNSSALDTQFKVCISSAVLGAGHGAQPTYEALASMAAGSMPAYLKVPTAFPSVQDQGDDSDLDLD
jgi:hypothetical protein